jgi:hypothetical protein
MLAPLGAAKAELQPKFDAVASAREAAVTAENARVVAAEAARKAALDRITILQDVLDRIAAIASPRSSLIISDESLSSETGKDTEFGVLMSGEPQGGIKFRRRGSENKVLYERPRNLLPFVGPYSTR